MAKKKEKPGAGDVAQALLCELGVAGYQDLKSARLSWKKAAMAGNGWAQLQYASMLAAGKGGKKDVAEAEKWFTEAASNGFREADGAVEQLVQAEFRGAYIVIIESDRKVNDTISQAVNAAGYRVRCYSQVEPAWEFIKSHSQDVAGIFADNSSEISGIQFLETIRKDQDTKNLKFTMVSSSKDSEQILRAKNLRVDGWLMKPIILQKLDLMIRRLH